MATIQQAGDDRPVEEGSSLFLIKAVEEAFQEAKAAKRTRLIRNKANRDAFLSIQDFSYKAEGQSTEFLPKTAVAVEQLSAFMKKGLLDAQDFFSVSYGREQKPPIRVERIRDLMKIYLNKLAVSPMKSTPFSTIISDLIKIGGLESLCILKIHGEKVKEVRNKVGPDGELVATDFRPWRPRIDIVSPEDYYPDPTGKGLYEIHFIERDFHEVKANPMYDQEVVEQLRMTFVQKPAEDRRPSRAQGQDEEKPPSYRRKVKIKEYWGSILNEDGEIAHENVVCAVANDKFIIRSPEPNPFWHRESPFVVAPLTRVPLSVWHRALFDDASRLNLALNEIFNLMLDGGLAAVWGIRQVRSELMRHPEDFQGGIPQGATIDLVPGAPENAKVVENLTEGSTIPVGAQIIFELANSEFTTSALSNELRMGRLPQKEVLATEVLEVSQAQAVTLESVLKDTEVFIIGETLRKTWLNILQNANDLDAEVVEAALGTNAAFMLARMTPAQRFAAFAPHFTFKVDGLSSILSRSRNIQKLLAVLQVTTQNPVMLQAFFKRFSPNKLLDQIFKDISLNPLDYERSEEELAQLAPELQELFQFAQLAGGKAVSAEGGAGSELAGEVNQAGNPLTGLTDVGG